MAVRLSDEELSKVLGGTNTNDYSEFVNEFRQKVSLIGPYWIDSDGSGTAYTAYTGKPDLYAECREAGKNCPYLVTMLDGTPVGWTAKCNIQFIV